MCYTAVLLVLDVAGCSALLVLSLGDARPANDALYIKSRRAPCDAVPRRGHRFVAVDNRVNVLGMTPALLRRYAQHADRFGAVPAAADTRLCAPAQGVPTSTFFAPEWSDLARMAKRDLHVRQY